MSLPRYARAKLTELLKAYTNTGAWLAGEDENSGSLEAGKVADLIVLERNLFESEPMELKNVRTLLTLVGGQPVYRDPRSHWPRPAEK